MKRATFPLSMALLGLSAGCLDVLGYRDAVFEEPTGSGGSTSGTGTGAGTPGTGCNDGQKNDDETDVDCGGLDCMPCADEKHCKVSADCLNLICDNTTCSASTCTDGIKNGEESAADCGGTICKPCVVGQECGNGNDCETGVCQQDKCKSNHVWSKAFGGMKDDVPGAVVTDSSGSSIVAGTFQDSIDFGGGTLSTNDDAIFVTKFDGSGNHVWSRTALTGINGFVRDMAAGGADSLFIAGDFQGSLLFDEFLNSVGNSPDAYVVKLDAAGNELWGKSFGNTGVDRVERVNAVANGDLVITGAFQGSVSFGGLAMTAANASNDFLVKLDKQGDFLWGKQFALGSVPFAVDANGNVMIATTVGTPTNFGEGSVTPMGAYDAVLVKYDKNGVLLWTKQFGGPGKEGFSACATDPSGNIVVLGFFDGALDLGGGALASATGNGVAIAKFDPDGNHLWSKKLADVVLQGSISLAVDLDGGILVSSAFAGIVDFGGGPLTSAGDTDLVLVKLDSSGNHRWSQRFGGGMADAEMRVDANDAGYVSVAAPFGSSIDFGGGKFTANGQKDISIARLLLP